jgi:hypothetical protein
MDNIVEGFETSICVQNSDFPSGDSCGGVGCLQKVMLQRTTNNALVQ